jgi:hypothetical protein
MCWPWKPTGAPWNSRNLYLPDSLPKAITEPRKGDRADDGAEEQLEAVAHGNAGRPSSSAMPQRRGLGHGGHRDEHRGQADHASA